jgi:hypothetical protein
MQIDLCNTLHIMALSSLAIEGNQVAIKLLDLIPKKCYNIYVKEK